MKVVRFTGMLALGLGLGLAASCMSEPGNGGGAGQTGIALEVDILDDTDVAGFRYVIERDRCAGETGDIDPLVITQDVDLEDVAIPGGALEDDMFAPGSRHLIADFFVVLPPGCYDVSVLPITAGGGLSEDCTAAEADNVVVEPERTTEILLLSTCRNVKNGALDVIVGLNHQPIIENLEFFPSKFIFECEALTICVTARDPDNDPLEIDWRLVSGLPLFSGPTVVPDVDRTAGAPEPGDGGSGSNPSNEVRECVQIAADKAGDRELVVQVWDLMRNEEGDLVRVNDLLEELDIDSDSSASLRFPVHVLPDLNFLCWEEETDTLVRGPGMREPILAAGCNVKLDTAELICAEDMPEAFCPGGEADFGAAFGLCADQ